jgi:DNA-directed RNA polymerase specialized sigma24 family protein
MVPRISNSKDFLDHLRAGLAGVPAVPPAATARGAGDDALHSALPATTNQDALALIIEARDDPLFAELERQIAADPGVLAAIENRLVELQVQHEATDYTTPYAENDAESGRFVEAAQARARETAVLLLVLLERDSRATEFIASLTTPEAQRAASDRMLGRISDRAVASLFGLPAVLFRYLSARREGSAAVDQAARDLLDAYRIEGRRRGHDPDAYAQAAFYVILDRIERPGAYRRAELKAPQLVNFLRRVVRVADDGEAAHEVEIELLGTDEKPARELIIHEQGYDVVEENDYLTRTLARLPSALESLPERQRQDYEAVRLRPEPFTHVAVRTGRSVSAVSQSVSSAEKRIRKILTEGP